MTLYYDGLFLLSVVLMVLYVLKWHKHFDVHITLMFLVIPITNLGYCMVAQSATLEEAILSNKLTYIGGCYALLINMLLIFSLCDLKINRWLKAFFFTVSTCVYIASLTAGKSQLFYRSITMEKINGVAILHKEYGPLHTVFIVMTIVYFVLSLAGMIYSYFNKNQISKKLIGLMFAPIAVAMATFFIFRRAAEVELIPAVFDLALINCMMIVNRIALYDVTDNAIDSLVKKGDTGFVSIAYDLMYLGSNETAKRIFPELNELTVDRRADRNEHIKNTMLKWIEQYKANPENNTALYEKENRTYLITIRELFDGWRNRGYQLFLTDDTANQQYINLINHFNEDLKQQVAEKTEHIVEMHDNLIMSMATMVESRDNSTGGHIRRTSEGVRILTEEIRQNNSFNLSDTFCQKLIKAAPMHDLGKIAVDDAVLRKPGRFTPEEFEIMKKHAPEGARIVHEILKGTDDEEFKEIAENVAHFHHERWDGSGYPDGLKGTQIPLEARIMAIADVYDALVSKRVYKDKMSFEKADAIITEGMGTQFDPQLQPFYNKARPKLEQYYSHLEND